MFEILQREWEWGMNRDGTPRRDAELAPTFLQHVTTLDDVRDAFNVLLLADTLRNEEREDRYIARDMNTGNWFTPDDLRELDDAEDEENDEDSDLPF